MKMMMIQLLYDASDANNYDDYYVMDNSDAE